MAMIEDAIVNLKVDDSDASSKWLENKEAIKEMNAELRRMKEAGEAGSEGYKEIQRELRDVKAEQKEMLHNVDLTTASINQMQDAVNFWTREAKKAEQGSEEWVNATKKIDEIRPILNDAQTELRGFGTEVEKQPGLWDSMKTSVLSVFTGVGLFELAKAAGTAMIDFGKEVFDITAKFEKYDAILTNSLGSHEAAKAAMEDIKTMAATTPFSVDELTNSYIKYVNRGLTPSMEEMTKLGDIASSQGKSFEQLTEAVLDAGTGEFERLKEFGIQASKAGDEVTFSFKGIQTTVANTPEAINKAIMAFGELEGVQGSMAAISATLEGRVSNLGDQYDSLQLMIGDFLKPTFVWFLGALADGMDFMRNLLAPTGEFIDQFPILSNIVSGVSMVFEALWDVIVGLWEVGSNLVSTLFDIGTASTDAKGKSEAFEKVMEVLGFAVRFVGSLFMVAVTAIQSFVEGLNIAQNKAKELANYFGADFKIDTSATWDNLAKHAADNFSKIDDIWKKTAKDGEKYGEIWVDEDKKQNDKKVINHGKATDDISKRDEKARKEKEKIELEIRKKVEAMDIKAIADDSIRKTKQLTIAYNKELEWANKNIKNKIEKAAYMKKVDFNLALDIAKINDEARKKEASEEDKASKEKEKFKKIWYDGVKKTKDQALKDTKELLDNEFISKTNEAKLSLVLAKDNSQAIHDAKTKMMDLELAHKKAQLDAEAAAEKARIAESISDTETKAAKVKSVDEKLKSQLDLADAEHKQKADELDKKATADKNKRKDDFYKGLNIAMTGDLNAFIKHLQEKAKNDGKHFDERLVKTSENAQKIGGVMLTAINTLMQLNKQYTDDKIAKLESEKNANAKKLEADYKKGVITKEELDKKLLDLDNKFKEDSQVLRKKEFERGKKMAIAQALIQGSLAVLSALATPPIFLGLAMAITAGVKTALDIKKIKNQKFEGAQGGTYFKNAGIARGGRHGAKYGDGGIAMYDRATGNEVGEIEGDEPVMVLSRNTYANNGPLIERLLHSSLHRNGEPVTMRDGGIMPISDFKFGDMMLFGSKKRKAARAQAAEEQAEADAASSGGGEFDSEGAAGSSNEIIAKNAKISEAQLKAAKETAENTEKIAKTLKDHTGILNKIASKDSGAASLMHAIQQVQHNIGKATLK
jgi:hypothetical protein